MFMDRSAGIQTKTEIEHWLCLGVLLFAREVEEKVCCDQRVRVRVKESDIRIGKA
jgi:hypothetical protein